MLSHSKQHLLHATARPSAVLFRTRRSRHHQRCKRPASNAAAVAPLQVSGVLAAARAKEAANQENAIIADPHASALCDDIVKVVQGGAGPPQEDITRSEAQDVIATRYLDDCLLNALMATNLNTINQGDYRQVVVVGDGMDTRLWRLPVPEGTIMYCVAPAEVHARAEEVLQAQGVRAPRGTLLKRVVAELHTGGAMTEALLRAGFRGDRLSVWILQGLHQLGAGEARWEEVLVEVANLAAYHSLVAGELPPLTEAAADNLLGEAGLLASLVPYGCPAAEYGRWKPEWGVAAPEAVERRLFSGQQVRLSLEEMGIYEDHSAAAGEADEDFFGNFS